MTKPHGDDDDAPRPDMASRLAAPVLQLDLPAEVEALRRSLGEGQGHVGKTLAKQPDLRIVLMALASGGHLSRHQAPGRVCIHVLDGHVSVRLDDHTAELKAGGLLELGPNLPHEVEARAPSAMLLTIAWPKS